MRLSDRQLGRLISGLELGDPAAATALDAMWRPQQRAEIIGLSGPPGSGKSVLLGQLLHRAVDAGRKTAALAIDPSSPFSGGAVLGDRMRMQALGVPKGVYIRSLASRGALGGLAAVVPAALRACEAAGFQTIFIETVGVGQSETDIVRLVDTVVLVQSPGAGDEVQGLKSGILEIADLYVLNKSDLPGAEQARATLQEVAGSPKKGGWMPPVVSTTGPPGAGVDELWKCITAHLNWIAEAGLLKERRDGRLVAELQSAATEMLSRRIAEFDLENRLVSGTASIRESLLELFGTSTDFGAVTIEKVRR